MQRIRTLMRFDLNKCKQLTNNENNLSLITNSHYLGRINTYSILSRYQFPPKKVLDSKTHRVTQTEEQKREKFPSPLLKKGEKLDLPSVEALLGTDDSPEEQPKSPKSLSVAIVGAPNAGKSTLVNQIIGEKVSIVSNKSQTTREQTIGVFTKDNYQIVFLDTPGIVPFEKAHRVQKAITTTAWNTIQEADLTVLIVDGKRGVDSNVREILKQMVKLFRSPAMKAIIVVNKSDKLESKEHANQIVHEIHQLAPNIFINHFIVSAIEGTGVQDIVDYFYFESQDREWLYSNQKATITPDVKRATEIIREQVYKMLYQELPYVVSQETIGWTELPNGDLRIDQMIYVAKESQKAIVIGKNGSVLLEIKRNAIAEIKNQLKRDVQLFFTVRVRKD